MKAKTRSIPGVEIGSHASSLFGGIVAYWTDEGNTVPRSKPGLRMINLTAHKMMMLSTATNELVDDSAIGWDQMMGGCSPRQ